MAISMRAIYQVWDGDKLMASFAEKEDAEEYFLKLAEFQAKPIEEILSLNHHLDTKPNPEKELLDLLEHMGFTVGKKKTVKELGTYWPVSRAGQKAHLWNCHSQGWQLCPTDPRKEPSSDWQDVFDFDLYELADCNDIQLEPED